MPTNADLDDIGWFSRSPTIKRVLVVGAGVAGLQVARALSAAGFRVVVLEQQSDVGGVWATSHFSYRPEAPWEFYRFPDFPPPGRLDHRPSDTEIREYVKKYAKHFNLSRLIKLNCKLVKLTRRSKGGWKAVYQDTKQNRYYMVHVDFAVVCTGIYSLPNIPDYEGWQNFRGLQLHSKDFKDSAVLKGRKVVIVGAGKTALDCVVETVSCRIATSVTVLYRQAHWPLISKNEIGEDLRSKFSTRKFSLLLQPYYADSKLKRAISALAAPFRSCFWSGWERKVRKECPCMDNFAPTISLQQDLLYGGQILDSDLFQSMADSGVKFMKGEIHHFAEQGVVLTDSTYMPADVVVYCTGYTKGYGFLDSNSLPMLGMRKDGLYLYRNIIAPSVPGLAFIGAEVSTYNNILTSGLQAQWLLRLLCGQFTLPPVEAMHQDIRQQQTWKRRIMPNQRLRGASVMLYQNAYHDQLVKDMGMQPKRKNGFFKECCQPYTASDYADIFRSPLCDPKLLSNLPRFHDPSSSSTFTILSVPSSDREPADATAGEIADAEEISCNGTATMTDGPPSNTPLRLYSGTSQQRPRGVLMEVQSESALRVDSCRGGGSGGVSSRRLRSALKRSESGSPGTPVARGSLDSDKSAKLPTSPSPSLDHTSRLQDASTQTEAPKPAQATQTELTTMEANWDYGLMTSIPEVDVDASPEAVGTPPIIDNRPARISCVSSSNVSLHPCDGCADECNTNESTQIWLAVTASKRAVAECCSCGRCDRCSPPQPANVVDCQAWSGKSLLMPSADLKLEICGDGDHDRQLSAADAELSGVRFVPMK